MNLTPSEENYIKHIYLLQEVSGGVSCGNLANAMNTKSASVTEMLKKLNQKKIINYAPYQEFTLTETGNKAALEIVRKHRLWEFFLVNNLGFSWDEVHEIAEELEHVSSTKLVNRLDDYLGNPSFDPHGDPIPDSKGKIKQVKQLALTEMPLKTPGKVSGIKDQSSAMLQMLKHYQINIGSVVKVTRHFEFDGSVEIKIEKLAPAILSSLAAQNIYCII